MKITQGNLDIIHSHKLTDQSWEILESLADFKVDDNGYSFITKKETISGFVQEMKDDSEDFEKKDKDEIPFLEKIINSMKTNLLFINQNGSDTKLFETI